MATATRTRRTRTATPPAFQHVQLKSGRGTVHLAYLLNGEEYAFPACREWRTGNDRRTRYTMTESAIDCASCNIIMATDRATTPPAATRSRRNGKAQDEAAVKAAQIIGEKTNEIIAKRGTHVELDAKRLPKCSDEDYALAMRVRELRAAGEAWWRIAQTLGLPGAGASAKQGKTGAAHARRAWEKAWGATYKDTSVPRETRAIKTERALTQPGRPYFQHDDTDDYIVGMVTGHEIEWVTRLGAGDSVVCSVQRAEVSADARIDVVQGPKGRVLRFYEIIRDEKGIPLTGPHRSVYVDRIEKVGR